MHPTEESAGSHEGVDRWMRYSNGYHYVIVFLDDISVALFLPIDLALR